MPSSSFAAERPDPTSPARLGRLVTPHGVIETPAFVVLGTQGAVKSLQPHEVVALGAQAVLANTYHLSLRPGADVVAELGGLHAFTGWSGPLFTDSGSLQVVSRTFGPPPTRGRRAGAFPDDDVSSRRRPNATATAQAKLVRVDDDGITYRSHIDGSTHRLTPESAVVAQERLGADIIIALDEPTAAGHDLAHTARALARTHRWAAQSLAARQHDDQALFGLVQGGTFKVLRQESATYLGGLPFDGYVIGHAHGTTTRDLLRVLDWTVPALPEDRPRHLSGIGAPADILRGVERGIDLFDSALPLWQAQRGILLTADGLMNIRRAVYREDDGPVDPACPCPTCTTFSRAYLRHLFVADEMLAATLATTHNLACTLGLMARIRSALVAGTFTVLKADVLRRFGTRSQ